MLNVTHIPKEDVVRQLILGRCFTCETIFINRKTEMLNVTHTPKEDMVRQLILGRCFTCETTSLTSQCFVE